MTGFLRWRRNRSLTNYQGANYRPVWSPDGSTLAFISDRDGNSAVYSVPTEGIASPELLFAHPGEDIDEVNWSSDGDWLIYRIGTSDNNRDVYVHRLRPDTLTIAVSADPDVDERAPVLSPNRRWLAYVSNERGQAAVWIRPFPDVERGSRQVSPDFGVVPLWSSHGDELFFRARPGFTSLSVRTEGEFWSGAARVLFSNQLSLINTLYRTYDYDAAHDRFLMIRDLGTEEAEAQQQLVLIQNFIEDVKDRVGR
jgi:Tol biopolymer transport system component